MLLGNLDCVCVCVFSTKKVAYSACTVRSSSNCRHGQVTYTRTGERL